MKRVTKIGDIYLKYPLFLKESFQAVDVKSVITKTISGGVVVSDSTVRNSAKNLTLVSLESGWVKKEDVIRIRDLSDGLGVSTTIVMDGDEIDVRFRHEVNGGAIQLEEIHEGSNYCKGTIFLARI